MSQLIPLKIVKDEDLPAIKKKKSRNPKPRDKWSLLWQIPSKVLNLREEVSDNKGQIVKKGNRFGFDTYKRLSCKVCRKTFHKYQSLSFHSVDAHKGSINPPRIVSQSYKSLPQCSSSSELPSYLITFIHTYFESEKIRIKSCLITSHY